MSAWFAIDTEMEQLQISPAAMLEDEISWLDNFEPTWTSELETSEADNILLAGHLRLIKTLLSLCGNEKEQFGSSVALKHNIQLISHLHKGTNCQTPLMFVRYVFIQTAMY